MLTATGRPIRRAAMGATSRLRSPVRTAASLLAWTSRRRSTSWVGMVMTALADHCGCGARRHRWTFGANFARDFRPGVQCALGVAHASLSAMDRLSALDA